MKNKLLAALRYFAKKSVSTLWNFYEFIRFIGFDCDQNLSKLLNYAVIKSHNVIICGSANRSYIPLMLEWFKKFSQIKDLNCIIFALDKSTYYACVQNNIPVLYTPFRGSWIEFLRFRMNKVKCILESGYNCIHTDIDAFWLKNPLDFTMNLPADMVFSPGSVWPPRALSSWGNVCCGGYFMLRSNENVIDFLESVDKRMTYEGDQPALNHELLDRGLSFNIDKNSYYLTVDNKNVLQSYSVRFGTAKDLAVALLPNKSFQRIIEPDFYSEAYIIHPLAPKICKDKINMFKKLGLISK